MCKISDSLNQRLGFILIDFLFLSKLVSNSIQLSIFSFQH